MTIQDAIKSAVNNARSGNANSQKIAQAKRTLLQRMSIDQLQEIYDKYCYVVADTTNIITAFSAAGKPTTRQQFVEKIAQNMSWDSLRTWAEDNKIKYEDLER